MDDYRSKYRSGLGGSSGLAQGSKAGAFVKGGVQKSNVEGGVNEELVTKSHYTEERPDEGPDPKKSKMDMIHDEDYQKKLFSAAQNYMGKKHKQDLMDNIRRFNWKVQNGQKSSRIKANDIKGYLHIWCNQRRVTPEFNYKELGNRHKKLFSCSIQISGLDFVAIKEARSKKEAQNEATWEYCNKLAELGFMDKEDFPKKEKVATNAAGSIPQDWHQIVTSEHINEAGGWTPDSCQKRLMTFCSTEKVSCEIQNSSMGPDHAKIQIAELRLTLKKYGKEFYAKEQARTKKTANALVSWSIVKQLFLAKMIEECGSRVRRPNDIKNIASGAPRNKTTLETIDESTGDWTLDTARQKLHEFLAKRKIALEYIMEEKGMPSHRIYIAKLDFTIDGKQYAYADSAANKKAAQKKTALELCMRLFKDGKIGANVAGPGVWMNPRRAAAINNDPPEKLKPPKPIKNMDKRERDEYACKVKLESIMPVANFQTATTLFMDHIQKTLKEVSDVFLNEERENPDNQEKLKSGEIKSVEALREILGVMQVGALAGQINLKGETEFLAVLMTKNKPTFPLLEKLAHKISEHMSQTYHENYKVIASRELGGLELFRLAEPRVTILMSVASPKSRPPLNLTEDTKPEPEDPTVEYIPNDQCLRALAELRRAKWYHVCAQKVQNCTAVARIIRDMTLRVPTWNILSDWNIQLLVQKALESAGRPLPISDGVQRIFSCLAGGLIIKGGEGIIDPCEREPVDAMKDLSEQDREDITSSAQHALRLMGFDYLNKILGIPSLEAIARQYDTTAPENPEDIKEEDGDPTAIPAGL